MKKLLVIVNTVLVFLLGISLFGAFFGGSGTKLEVGKKKSARKSQDVQTQPASAPQKFKVPSSDEAVSIIVNKNVFDSQRTGGATGRGGAVTYTLVGFYRVGNSQGAIITSKGNMRNRNGMPNKQYFRVGETLPNGYTLSSIENNQAILSRGSSNMTLSLAFASEVTSGGGGNRRPQQANPMQQMVNLMQQSIGMQRMQQMNMMQMMRNNQSRNSSRGGSTNGRRR